MPEDLDEKAHELLAEMNNYGVSIPRRTVYLFGEIDSMMARDFIYAMDALECAGSNKIYIVMNSCGGNVNDGWAIYDRIRRADTEVVITICGQASSMAAAIVQACAIRKMEQNAEMCIHNGETAHKLKKNDDIEKKAREIAEDNDHYWRVLLTGANRGETKMELQDIERLCREDRYINANTALGLGLVDEIV